MLKVHIDIDNCKEKWQKIVFLLKFNVYLFLTLICKLYWVHAVMAIENQIE